MISLNPKVKDAIEWLVCILIAIVLALIVRFYIGTPTVVESSSMEPTLIAGQRLVLNRLTRTNKARYYRGDIVTFEAPLLIKNEDIDLSNPIAKYDEPKGLFEKFSYYVLELTKTSYIKRVIGLPGEHVTIKDGSVYINGLKLSEPYLTGNVQTTDGNGQYLFVDFTVPEGTYFLMGDNRKASMDSRKFGCIPEEKIESRVWIRFWPFNLFGKVK